MNNVSAYNKNVSNAGFYIACIVISLLLVCVLSGCESVWSSRQNEKKDPYYAFIDKNSSYGKVITEKELYSNIMQGFKERNSLHSQESQHLTDVALNTIIIDALNIDFLLKRIDKRPLVTTVDYVKQEAGYIEKKMSIHDEDVGRLEFLVLTPTDILPERFPVVLGFHGHGPDNMDAYRFKRDYMGKELAQNGFIVVIPTFKHMNMWKDDKVISTKFLLNGFTLMGIRVYESLLLLKFIDSMPAADNERIGVIAQSGGNAMATFIGRLTDSIRCQVRDEEISEVLNIQEKRDDRIYKMLFGGFKRKYYFRITHLHCQVIPKLAPYEMIISDKAELPYPVLDVEYEYFARETRENILDFLTVNLKER